ncbi:RNA 2',3'-cyclic phosphodiesterase [Candidatus Woesearchaeota archaeon]|nr:RNA 2',3'-cyclic phosphodiesterase [Candidatus Woesearchaeota archaeon]
MRLFVAVELPESVLSEAERISSIIASQDIKANFVRKEAMHITMLFLGEVPEREVQEIKEQLSRVKHKEFAGVLTRVGVFPSWSFIRVVWLGVEGSGFKELHEKIAKALSQPPMKAFTSHITLARVKHIADKPKFVKKLQSISVENIEFKVTKFQLMSSVLKPDGPEYTTLAEFKLVE